MHTSSPTPFEFGATPPLPLLISRLIGPDAAARRLSGPSFSSFFFCHQNGHSAKSGRGEFHPRYPRSRASWDPQWPGSPTVRYPRASWDPKVPGKLRGQPRTGEAKKVDSRCQKCSVCVIHDPEKWEWPMGKVGLTVRRRPVPEVGLGGSPLVASFQILHLVFIS